VVAGALLFPVMIFIATTTRLAAARREQRFAAMRLVGATPRQISVVSAVEATVVAAVGVAGAFALFLPLRALVARVPFTGARFFTSDLSLNPTQVAVVALGVPIVAAVVSRVALRRVQISPLGVTRRVTPRAPGAWRLVPLVAGVGELALMVVVGRPDTTPAQITAYAPGFVLIMVGLLLAGPWLTMVGARRMARRTGKPAALIAGQRLADNPKAGFRAISGLILALFIASAAVGSMKTFADEHRRPTSAATETTLTQEVWQESMAPLPSATRAHLAAIAGVEGVTEVHNSPASGLTVTLRDHQRVPAGLTTCAELAHTPALGRCRRGAEVAIVPAQAGGWEAPAAGWPTADVDAAQIAARPMTTVAVATDGSTAALEQARTVLGAAYPDVRRPATIDETTAEQARIYRSWQQLVDVVVLMTLVIAGCSLAVSVAAGLLDRKRPFSLLRLTGVPVGVLRRVVALESVVPLVAVAAVSSALGFVAAALFVRVQLDTPLEAPGLDYYAVVALGLVGSLAVIGSTLPLLDRITGPEAARNG
jgi:hypothetical protein